MRKTISRKVYDTEKSTLIAHNTCGAWGDPAGYEEFLYKTAKGYLFIYGIGGTESKYPEETIGPVTEEEAAKF